MKKKVYILFIIAFTSINAFSQDKIVNGNDANITDFPWQIALEKRNDMIQPVFAQCCGGSIINENWVLTAAHCVWWITDTMAFGNTEFRIKAGIELLSSTGGQTINVDAIYMHPNYYVNYTTDYDFALLHLETPLTLDGISTKAISLVSYQDSANGLTDPGVNGILSGWGNIDTNGANIDRLQYLEAPIYSLTNANQAIMWDGQLAFMHLPIMPTANSGMCFGDSGGPFVVPNQDTSAYLLAGLISFIYDYCGDGSYADVLARVSVCYNWVDSVTNIQLAINENHISNLKIYPNPTKGIFTIEGKDIQSVEIVNNIGQVIFSYQYPENNNQNVIDMGNRPNGIYFVKIVANKKLIIEKLIINNAN